MHSLLQLPQLLLESTTTLFYPPHCAICKKALTPENDQQKKNLSERNSPKLIQKPSKKLSKKLSHQICPSCYYLILHEERQGPECPCCAHPLMSEHSRCPNCHDRSLATTAIYAPFHYRGIIQELICRFKYGKEIYLLPLLGELLYDYLTQLSMTSWQVIVPIPLHTTRERTRGFNQAHLLATYLAKKSSLKVVPLLRRHRATNSQAEQEEKERLTHLQGAFSVHPSSKKSFLKKRLPFYDLLSRSPETRATSVPAGHYLLLDDVITTAATIDESARTLKAGGATSVSVLAIARGRIRI